MFIFATISGLIQHIYAMEQKKSIANIMNILYCVAHTFECCTSDIRLDDAHSVECKISFIENKHTDMANGETDRERERKNKCDC